MKFFSLSLFTSWLLVVSFYSTIQAQNGPDSGRTLAFTDAAFYRVNIPDAISFDHPTNDISIEAWVYPTSYGAVGGMVFSKHETGGTREYDMVIQSNGTLRFALFNTFDVFYPTFSVATIPLNTWTHLAGTYSSASGMAKIYINGIVDVTNNLGPVVIASTATQPLIGAYWLTNNVTSRSHFTGSIDEVRLWHVERTQTEIRDNMCQTLVPPLANLIAYYRLDEASGLIAGDVSGNGNDGALENFPAGQIAARNYSGAPVGDQSIYTYTNTFPLVLNSTLPPPAVGSLTINNVTGAPSGFHLFRVDHVPSQTGGLSIPANKYFGTFIIKGAAPTYNVIYNYSSTGYDGGTCENYLVLKQRDDNSVPAWALLPNTLNTVANTLIPTTSISSRKEIILDCSNALPVDFISFDLIENENDVVLNWTTAHEFNNRYFIIEKSKDLIQFTAIGQVETYSSKESIKNYEYLDQAASEGTTYYRLKQVDIDGSYKYSEIKTINKSSSTKVDLYPNPNEGSFKIKTTLTGNWNFKIQDENGQEVYNYKNDSKTSTEPENFELPNLPPGFYTLLFYYENGMISKKLIIQ